MKLEFKFLLLFIGIISCADYRTARASGYWEIPVGEFDQTKGDNLMAFADFNNDGFTDIVSIDSINNLVLAINIWNEKSNTFIRNQLLIEQSRIVSVIAIDMNFDGITDIVYTQMGQNTYSIRILLINCQTNCSYIIVQDPTNILVGVDQVEPFILDLHGTRVPQIFFVREGVRHHAALQNLTLTTDTFDSHVQNPLNSQGFKTYPEIIYPELTNHFASLVDLNGDCMTDLVLISHNDTSTYLQFYTNLKNGLLSQPKFIEIQQNVKSISFADVNFDGANDLVLLYGQDDTTIIEVHINKYPGNANNLCSIFSQFPYDFAPLIDNQIQKIQRFVIPGIVEHDSSIKFTDMNLDGYADIVLSLLIENNGVISPQGRIYINTQCYAQNCGQYNPTYTILANTSNLRYFALQTPTTFNLTNVTSVAPFDLYEDGIPDLLLNRFVTKNIVGNVTYIVAILNNKQQDAFFTKITTKNGAIQSKYSASLSGACYEWIVTGLGGNYLPAVGTQGMQVSHKTLPLPFTMSGLGRTNNYIQDLSVGIPSNNNVYIKSWSPLIPNTQLVISTVNQPSKWQIAMRIQATQKLKMIMFLTIVALCLVGIMIYYYHRKQQLQNRQNIDSFYVALS